MKAVQPKAVASSASVSTGTESAVAAPAIRVLKIASCTSLSGKSTLTYELGCTSDSEIQIRIKANSGGGFFSQEWISLKSIEDVLEKTAAGTPLTTTAFLPIFSGRSVNTAGFLLAVLKDVGLVRLLEHKRRCFETVDPALFVGEVNVLIASSVDLKADDQPKPEASNKKDAPKGKKKAA